MIRYNAVKTALLTLAILVAVFSAGCGGSQQNPVTPTASSAVTAPGIVPTTASTENSCPTCSQQGKPDPSLVSAPDTQFTKKTVITVAADPDGGMPKFYDAANKELAPEEAQSLVRKSLVDDRSAVYFKPIVLEKPGVLHPHDWEYKNQIGCYWFRISWESGYIGSCIHRNSRHLGFTVRNNCNNPTTLVFDGHACGWWENGPQFGLYDSKSGWCRQTRGGFTNIKDTFYAGLLSAGIVWWLAGPIADISAGVAVVALAV